jgi:ribonuclease D
VDAERASSFRYGHHAYLIQLRRADAGTVLIDPTCCPDLSPVGAALGSAEWVVHAAGQDLPCLAELGLRPPSLFDTELAGRLAGLPRVGLAAMVENLLGRHLAKSHSAADWSRRPLPEPWLRYAALDVEALLELRELLETELRRQGKLDWARQEFEHVRTAPPRTPPAERWRRTSGMHRLRNRRQLAVVRAMWDTRDQLARAADVSPTKLLPDASIVFVAVHPPSDENALAACQEFVGRGSRRHLHAWWSAISEALDLADEQLPPLTRKSSGPPPTHRWRGRDADAAQRLAAVKATIARLAETHRVPAENLVPPDAVRRVAWEPPDEPGTGAVASRLGDAGARAWQVAVVAAPIAAALSAATGDDPIG